MSKKRTNKVWAPNTLDFIKIVNKSKTRMDVLRELHLTGSPANYRVLNKNYLKTNKDLWE